MTRRRSNLRGLWQEEISYVPHTILKRLTHSRSRLLPVALSRLSAAGLFSLALLAPAARANLIVDGGFESPVVGPGGLNTGYMAFTVGQSFGPGNVWTVVGSGSGNIAVYPNTETTSASPGAFLNVEEGSQALDLTGNTDNGFATGVSQTFATVSGTQYTLSFFLGAFNGANASAVVNLNGNLFQTPTTPVASVSSPNSTV